MLTLICNFLWVRPLYRLEATLAAIAADPEQILPPDGSTDGLLPIQRMHRASLHLHKRVRQSIRQRQRLAETGQAVAKINHDLRNMLASVTLVTDQLESSDDPKITEITPIIIRATSQAADMCQNMMDYLSELPPPKPEVIDMKLLAAELRATAVVALAYIGPDRLYCDRMMLYRIFLNLLRNAGHAGADRVTIDIWQAGHQAVIDFSDNGPGVDPDIQDRIFSAFAGGRATHTGLGLSICLDLALAMGGRLSLSRTTAEGCEFRLQLPAAVLAAD